MALLKLLSFVYNGVFSIWNTSRVICFSIQNCIQVSIFYLSQERLLQTPNDHANDKHHKKPIRHANK